MWGLSDAKKSREMIGALLYTLWKTMLISSDTKKMWSGKKFALVPILLKIILLSLSASLDNCRLQLVSGLGREKLKTMLLYLMWVRSVFDRFDVYPSVHCSSGRSVHIHSLLRLFFQITTTLWRAAHNFARPGTLKIMSRPCTLDSLKWYITASWPPPRLCIARATNSSSITWKIHELQQSGGPARSSSPRGGAQHQHSWARRPMRMCAGQRAHGRCSAARPMIPVS